MPLGAGQVVLVEEIGVQERQLDRVGDLLDLAVEAADVLVGDVGHLFEDQVRRSRGGAASRAARPTRVHEDGVAAAQPLDA